MAGKWMTGAEVMQHNGLLVFELKEMIGEGLQPYDPKSGKMVSIDGQRTNDLARLQRENPLEDFKENERAKLEALYPFHRRPWETPHGPISSMDDYTASRLAGKPVSADEYNYSLWIHRRLQHEYKYWIESLSRNIYCRDITLSSIKDYELFSLLFMKDDIQGRGLNTAGVDIDSIKRKLALTARRNESALSQDSPQGLGGGSLDKGDDSKEQSCQPDSTAKHSGKATSSKAVHTRPRKDITQKQAAALCGVSERLFQDWEAGKKVPEGFTDRSNAMAFAAWANSYKQNQNNKKTMLAMNRATSVDPKIIEECHSTSAFMGDSEGDDARTLEELIREQEKDQAEDKRRMKRL